MKAQLFFSILFCSLFLTQCFPQKTKYFFVKDGENGVVNLLDNELKISYNYQSTPTTLGIGNNSSSDYYIQEVSCIHKKDGEILRNHQITEDDTYYGRTPPFTLKPEDDAWRYFTKIAAEDFSANEEIEVSIYIKFSNDVSSDTFSKSFFMTVIEEKYCGPVFN